MIPTLRSLTFGLAAAWAFTAMAQQPYTFSLYGTISGCYPGQTVNVQTIQGTQPAYNIDVPVTPGTCSWSASLSVTSDPAYFTASTMCNGMVVTYTDSADFNWFQDSAYVFITFDCGGDVYDCNGVLNGTAMPGTACDDGNGQSTNDQWQPTCICAGTYVYDCLGVINGTAMPGTSCDDSDSLTTGDAWSTYCNCYGDSSNYDNVDCLGINLGPNMPGTACDDGDPLTLNDVWASNCYCYGVDPNTYDCYGVINGPAMPGTPCDDGNPVTQNDTWTSGCYCDGDTLTNIVDCLGVLNGGALPSAPCTIPGTILTGTWSADCVCEEFNPNTCSAYFWLTQAMASDSVPIPYELWVLNQSSGSGPFTSNWDFGDGTSSTETYPTHTYAGNGPYVLCLTIVDNTLCTSTHCDSVSINGDGLYEGMIVHAEDRQEGFTINVHDPQSTAVQEVITSGNIVIWPNPAVDELNVAVVSEMKGPVTVTITDLDGRTVKTERTSLSAGRGQLRIATSGLNAGMYLLRISDGNANLGQRFVKTN